MMKARPSEVGAGRGDTPTRSERLGEVNEVDAEETQSVRGSCDTFGGILLS